MKRLIVGISAEGSVVLLDGQLKYFRDRGFETYLLSPESERVSRFCKTEGCTHLPVNIKREISPLHDILVLIKLVWLFIRYKPDIINLGTPKVSLLGMVAGKLTGVRMRIYTCRGFRFEPENGIKRKVLILMEKITARYSHKIICISRSLREYGIENRIFTETKSVVINRGSSNGINLKRFSHTAISREATGRLKAELGIEGSFVYGFVGRIYDRKGIIELYKAFNMLINTIPEIVLLLVGRYEESQISDKSIIELIAAHDRILHVGPQNNVPLYMSLMDVFVMPSWGEGFGNVMVEAAAMGIPVITSNATGTRDTTMHNFNGLLVEPRNVEQLYDRMLTLYQDSSLRDRLGYNGLEWAKNFDNQTIWEGMERLYLKMD